MSISPLWQASKHGRPYPEYGYLASLRGVRQRFWQISSSMVILYSPNQRKWALGITSKENPHRIASYTTVSRTFAKCVLNNL